LALFANDEQGICGAKALQKNIAAWVVVTYLAAEFDDKELNKNSDSNDE
jgi:hypothetical protein